MKSPKVSGIVAEISENCLNGRVRVLSRIITGVYDGELRAVGIKGSQLNLLVAIAAAGPVRRTDIGDHLYMDSSTLTRNLGVMETNGWIEESPDDSDGRGRPVRITGEGERVLERAAPVWRSAQRKAARLLSSEGKASLVRLVDNMTA